MHSGHPDLYPCPYVGFRHLNYDFGKGSTRFDVTQTAIHTTTFGTHKRPFWSHQDFWYTQTAILDHTKYRIVQSE